ncbi:MAG: hypothetical protein WBP03_01350 [Candidatus Saccharimonadales bacterium]|jgi:hypothetical protein
MKRRQYLHEDLAQIQRYFPGARPVSLRTPFDLTPPRQRLIVDVFRAEQPVKHWTGGLRWTM